MGFVRANTLPIIREHKRSPFSGSCLCLGQADVFFTYESLKRMARIVEVELVDGIAVTLARRPDSAAKGYISRETFFKSIGFKEVSALDKSDFEGAEFVFDLNNSVLPNVLKERFDVVINHGTMEHIFHVPNCLNNIFSMLKVGGRVIHIAPASNFLDHGFYMFSPTFFYDYFSANRWKINSIYVSQSLNTQNQEFEPPFYADYEPGIFDTLSSGGLDGKAYGVICIGTKVAESMGTAIPQQGYYTKIWEQDAK